MENWKDKNKNPNFNGRRGGNKNSAPRYWRGNGRINNSRANASNKVKNHRSERAQRGFENVKPNPELMLTKMLRIGDDAELILALSSKQNEFLLLLEQQNIPTNQMFLILATLARASQSSSEPDTVQLLVHFYVKVVPKLESTANFYREIKLYIADLCNNMVEQSHNGSHVTAVQNLLLFLHRLQDTIRHKSSNAVRDLMQLITVQIEFLDRKENALREPIVELLAKLNESAENLKQAQIEKRKQEIALEPPEDFRAISIYPQAYDILSNHEPFIRPNIVDGKYVAGIDHYLDVQFRLLREDFIRSLREGINAYRDLQNTSGGSNAAKLCIKDLNIYHNVKIIGSMMSHIELVHLCEFDCTPFRNVQWQSTKRLINGSMVCLSSDNFSTFSLGTVAGEQDPRKLARGKFQIKFETAMPEPKPFVRYVMVESPVYFEAYRHNLKVLQEFGKGNFPLEKYIVDVNIDISPPSYLPMNKIYRLSNGFPNTDPKAKLVSVEILNKQQWPPREDFNLDESQYEAFRAALTNQMVVIQGPPGTGKTYIGLRIVEALLLNSSQLPILIVCYTNHALDQFLEGILKFCNGNELIRIGGKSKSDALEKYNLASIKAALDPSWKIRGIRRDRYESICDMKDYQHRIFEQESKIKRIGYIAVGYELERVIRECNKEHYDQLQHLARGQNFNEAILNWLGYAVNRHQMQHQDNTAEDNGNDNNSALPKETYVEGELYDDEILEIERSRIIDQASDEGDEENRYNDHRMDHVIRDMHVFQLNEPVYLNQIVPMGEDNDGFMIVQHKRNSIKKQFLLEVRKTNETMSDEEAATVSNITSLQPNQRWSLYRLWIKLYVRNIQRNINSLSDAYRNECLRYNVLRNHEDIEIVKSAKIIGMTTTGAAKYRHIIDSTKPKITIVEEAAEVLEAHIVTALCKETDHLILIGDHLQLRPNPAVYDLAKKFNLEISLFERLINNEMEYFQLKQQHRMRPCISSLLVPHIYEQLLDHPSVEEYENVKGISKNMFFINHRQHERSMQDTQSHVNMHEASFIVEFCRYVILQGYKTSQVTILTTYSGQLLQIRQLMRLEKLLCDVHAAVVDNYQGEENDIILLSLVRSNEEGNIGFLKTSNRVNVALSRAKKCLYCIGNFDCLKNKSKLWEKLVADLAAQGAIGDALAIYCQNHTDYKSLVKSKEDFAAVPEGGCSRPCLSLMPCGHLCPTACHIIDEEHIGVYAECPEKCIKKCKEGHPCPKKCHYGKECGPCTINVLAQSPCGHTVTIECSDATNDSKLLDACTEPCNLELKCGHLCKGSCGRCKYGRLHITCEEKCTRTLICGHLCPDSCSIECAPCKEKCTKSCVHSKCSLRCGYPCAPCMKKCAWRCDHFQCSKLCSEACDRELCGHPETKSLDKCGHSSNGVCGEKMASLCRVCDKDADVFHGNDEDARFIELEDCEHIIEVKSSSAPDAAELSSDGSSQNTIQFKKCPKCKTIIRHTKSLNTFIQASLGDIEQIKVKAFGDPKENVMVQRNLNEKVKALLDQELFRTETISFRSLYTDVHEKTQFGKSRVAKRKQYLIMLANKLELTESLKKICLDFEICSQLHQNICNEAVESFKHRIRMAASFMEDYKNCIQQRDDISTEISFLQLMGDVILKVNAQPFNETTKNLLNDAFKVATKCGRATESVREEFTHGINKAFKQSLGIGVSWLDKPMVLRYMGFQRDYWSKCSNGHIYCVGERVGECPGCRAVNNALDSLLEGLGLFEG